MEMNGGDVQTKRGKERRRKEGWKEVARGREGEEGGFLFGLDYRVSVFSLSTYYCHLGVCRL